MANDNITIELQPRDTLGKGLARLRSEGKVPAVIHNYGQQSTHVAGEYTALNKVFAQAGKHHPVMVSVGDRQQLALIKDADFDPVKHQLRHMVFQAIKQNEETEAEVPVVFPEDAEIPAEKASLLVLKQLDVVSVKALPRDLPDQLVVNPAKLAQVGDSLSVADIETPQGVTILTDPEQQIAVVEMPRDQIAEADAAAASLAEDAAGSNAEPDDVSSEAEQSDGTDAEKDQS